MALLLFCSSSALALEIPVPERSSVTYSAAEPVQAYEVPGGPVQQAGGELRIENAQSLTGNRLRKTFELPKRTPLDETFQALRPDSGQVVFECVGRECGRSNLWANDLYQIRTLYGRDRDQRYRLVRDGDQWLSLYLVQRGNKRVYAHFEQIIETQQDIQAGQSYTLDVEFSNQDRISDVPALNQLQDALRMHPDWDFRILVRTAGDDRLDQLQRTSDRRAAALENWLVEQGIDVMVVSQGPLSGTALTADQVVWIAFKP